MQNISDFIQAPMEWRDNPQFILNSIEKFGADVFKLASKRLQDDQELHREQLKADTFCPKKLL